MEVYGASAHLADDRFFNDGFVARQWARRDPELANTDERSEIHDGRNTGGSGALAHGEYGIAAGTGRSAAAIRRAFADKSYWRTVCRETRRRTAALKRKN